MLHNIAKFIKNNILPIVLLAVVVAIEVVDRTFNLIEPESILIRIAFYLLLAFSIIYPKKQRYTAFQHLVMVSIPLSLLILSVMLHFKPLALDFYAHEDMLVENLSAIALVSGALIWITGSFILAGKRFWLLSIVAILASMVIFVIGMEEISWGQRIFNIESSDYFLENNSQEETNLHNLNTGLSERIYYSGAGVLLVIFAFYSAKITKSLKSTRLSWVSSLMPSTWLLFPFSIIFSIVGLATIYHKTLLFITVFAVAVLIYHLVVYTKKRNHFAAIGILTLLLIAVFTALSFATIDHESHGTRFWMYSEYLEFYIAIGLLAYTVDFMFRNLTQKKPRRSKRLKRLQFL